MPLEEEREDLVALVGVLSGPVRRRLKPDDEFFDAGNVQRALLCKVSVFAVEFRSAWDDNNDEAGMQLEEEFLQRSYECMFKGCPSTFSSLSRYEAHYDTSHRNRCCECGRSFPTNRLLDLHLSEEHDSFFQAMAERRPMYRCLVEGCTEVFQSTGKRAAHLVDLHRYPKSFDFSRPSYTRKGGGRRPKMSAGGGNGGGNKQKSCEINRHSGPRDQDTGRKPTARNDGRVTNEDTDGERGTDIVENVQIASAKSKFGNKQKRESDAAGVCIRENVEARSRPPRRSRTKVCKFWPTAEGCRAGSQCKFRHDTPPVRIVTGGVEVNELLSTSAVPGGFGVVTTAVAFESEPSTGWESGCAHDNCTLLFTTGCGRRCCGGDVAMDIVEDPAIDELVDGMKKLSVPSKLRFGRSARRCKPPSSGSR